MELHGGWNPIEGRRYSTIKDYGGDREPENKLDRLRVAAVVLALAAIGIAIYLLVSHPSILQGAKSLAMSIWDMLCAIANAFSDFIEYVKHQRSS